MKNPEHSQEFEASDDRYQSLSKGELDAKSFANIGSLKSKVEKQIAGTAGILSKKDRERWQKRLDGANDSNDREINSISADVEKEISEIKDMKSMFTAEVDKNSAYFALDKTRNLDEKSQWIKAFEKQDIETKREWVKGLAGRINELKELTDTAQNLAPKKMPKFARLKEKEKREFIKELEVGRKNSDKFEKLLEQNSKYFSPAEKDRIQENFEDMTSAEQEKFMAEFEKNELTTVKKLTEDFDSCPEEFKFRHPDFFSSERSKKTEIISQIEHEITADYEHQLFKSDLSKHLSVNSRLEAYRWFVTAPLKDRGMALKMLESQMKEEEKLSKQYEQLIGKLPKNYDQHERNRMLKEFYDSGYEKKKDMIGALEGKEKEDAAKEHEKLNQEYGKLLRSGKQDGIISEKTFQRETERFAKLSLEEKMKQSDLEHYNNAVAPRVELKKKFEELPAELQKGNQDFFELGHRDRMERYDSLKKIADLKRPDADKDESNKLKEKERLTPEEKQRLSDLKVTAREHELNENFREAQSCYEALLKVDPEDELTQKSLQRVKGKMAKSTEKEKQNKDILETIEQEKGKTDIRKSAKQIKLQKEFATAVDLNDQLNRTGVDVQLKESHLDSESQKIQRGLYKRTGMVLDKNGNAVKMVKTDMSRDLNEAEEAALKESVRTKARGRNINFLNNNFQITSEGQVISGNKALEKNAEQERRLKKLIMQRSAASLKTKGINIEESEWEKLKKLAETEELAPEAE